MMEEKDKEITRLTDENVNLQRSLEMRPKVCILSLPKLFTVLVLYLTYSKASLDFPILC